MEMISVWYAIHIYVLPWFLWVLLRVLLWLYLYYVYYLDLDLCSTQQLCTGVNVINLPGHGQ